METMKKFKIYFYIFILAFLIITLLTNLLMRVNYRAIDYKVKSNLLEMKVVECKAAYSTGYIKGSVTNNTGELIPLKYLQINLYNKDDVYLGSEYKELKNFYPQETINFDIGYDYINTDKVVLGLIDEIPQKEQNNFLVDLGDEQLEIAAPIAGTLLLFAIIP